jgi:hypothetical protein
MDKYFVEKEFPKFSDNYIFLIKEIELKKYLNDIKQKDLREINELIYEFKSNLEQEKRVFLDIDYKLYFKNLMNEGGFNLDFNPIKELRKYGKIIYFFLSFLYFSIFFYIFLYFFIFFFLFIREK